MNDALQYYDHATKTVTAPFLMGDPPILLAWLIENHYYFSKIAVPGKDEQYREVIMAVPTMKTALEEPIINTEYYKLKYAATVIDIIQKDFAMNVLGEYWVKKTTTMAPGQRSFDKRKIEKPETKHHTTLPSEATFSLFSSSPFAPTLQLPMQNKIPPSPDSDEETSAPKLINKKRRHVRKTDDTLLDDNLFASLPAEKSSTDSKHVVNLSKSNQTTAGKVAEYAKIIVAGNMNHEKKIDNKKEVTEQIIKAIHRHALGGKSFHKLQKKISKHLNLEYKQSGCLCFFRKKTVSLVFDEESFSRGFTQHRKFSGS